MSMTVSYRLENNFLLNPNFRKPAISFVFVRIEFLHNYWRLINEITFAARAKTLVGTDLMPRIIFILSIRRLSYLVKTKRFCTKFIQNFVLVALDDILFLKTTACAVCVSSSIFFKIGNVVIAVIILLGSLLQLFIHDSLTACILENYLLLNDLFSN